MNRPERYLRKALEMARNPGPGLEVLAPKRYIFVESHMRSYSSLLCHILNSNPEVAGYVETHRSYARRTDLWRLKHTVFTTTAADTGGRYVLDKLLHNRSKIDPVLLRRENVYVIFSIREPVRTIKSTVAMERSLAQDGWKTDPARVCRYYVKRLDYLRRLALLEFRHVAYIDAQDIIDDSPQVLDELTRFLSLSVPLTEEYQTSKLTGVPKYGDPGKYITTGSIVRDRDDYSDIVLEPEDLEPALAAYASAMDVLGQLRMS